MKGLKFGLMAVLIIVTSLGLVACGSSEPATETPAPAPEKVYVIGTDAAYPPFEKQEADKITGFDIDIINAIAEEMGIKIEVKHTGWDPLFSGIDNGSVDAGISAITITDERKLTYDFSNPYFEATQLIMVPTNSEVTTLQDLDGKKIGVQTATTGNFVVQDAFGTTYEGIKGYDDTPSAVDDLLLGRLDAVVVDDAVLKGYLEVVGEDGFKLIEDPSFEIEEYGIVVKKGNTELLAIINEGLQKIKANGKYDQIFQSYFAE